MSANIKILIIASILAATHSCRINKQQANNSIIKADQVAFIEVIQTQEGEVISGMEQQGRRIDGPTYRFDKDTKQLEILRKENFSIDTLKAIIGYVRILKGAAGSGLSARINATGKFPYTTNNMTITSANSEGVKITFEKKEFMLKDGEVWETKRSTMDTLKTETPTVIKYTITYSIYYHGLIDKKGVTQ